MARIITHPALFSLFYYLPDPTMVSSHSTTLHALKEYQYLLICLQTVNNNWWLLVMTCDVFVDTVLLWIIDFRTTFVLAIQFSRLLAGLLLRHEHNSLVKLKEHCRLFAEGHVTASISRCNGWESNNRLVYGWSLVRVMWSAKSCKLCAGKWP